VNYLELCRELVSECGYSGNIVTTEGQTGQLARIVRWIRNADLELQKESNFWSFMDREFEFLTEVDKREYTIADLADLDVENVGTWDKDKMQVTDAYGRSSKLFWSDFRLFHHRYQNSMIASGRPTFFAVLPEGGMVLGPAPDAEYSISGWYRLNPVALKDDEDVPLVPEPFHDAIVWKALAMYGLHEEAELFIVRGETKYREALHKMKLRYLPDVRMPGPLA
jgi:hypothetical protein